LDTSQTIINYQPLLQKIAYRIVGSIADAEDIVQDSFFNWLKKGPEKIENAKAYLMRSVVNSSLNHIKSVKRSLTDYLENDSEDRFFVESEEENFSAFDKNKEIREALKVLQYRLEPLERVIFILREIFDFDYETLQELIEKSKDNCRQLFSRAKAKLNIDNVSLSMPSFQGKEGIMESFKNACNFGQMSEFINDLMEGISTKLK